MPATETDLTIEQGAEFAYGWRVTVNGAPINATWTARAQVRKTVRDETILHTFAASVDGTGAVVIAVDADTSSSWEWRSGAYDVEIANADESITLRVARGTVQVSPEVTR